VSWDARRLRWTTFGVWVGSRGRWARVPGTQRLLVCQKLETAVEAARWLQVDYPAERFFASGIPTEPLDRSARWTEQQVANRRAYWDQQKVAKDAKEEEARR
jgi:hypothetical protein